MVKFPSHTVTPSLLLRFTAQSILGSLCSAVNTKKICADEKLSDVCGLSCLIEIPSLPIQKKVDFWVCFFPSEWQFVKEIQFKSLSLNTSSAPLTIRSNSDCLRRTTEEHCTYFTIQTLWIHRQRRGAWWEISAAFTGLRKLKHSSSARISVKCVQI